MLLAILKRPTRLLLTILALGIASTPAFADDPPATPAENPAAVATPAATPVTADAIAYSVEVNAPTALVDIINQSVDLVRWQHYTDMTEELLDRLARDAIPSTREAAATLGYFSATVEISIDRRKKPFAIVLDVVTGAPTRVTGVSIVVGGAAETTVPAGTETVARLQREWLLPKGDVFTQAGWDNAKTQALGTLVGSPFAAARLTHTEALIDPEARSAELDVVFDSGPAFHFGAFEVTGLSRYTKELVRNFSTISPGDLYSRSVLDDYIRRLLASGYFASVQASIDTSLEQADNATVTLAVIEAPTKRVELGAGFSTDTRYRVSASYSDMDIDGHALQFYADLRLESTTQSGHLRLVQPPTSKGWLDSYSLGLERTDIENLQTRTVSAVARRQYIDERNTPAFSAGYYWDQQTPDGGSLDQSHALYLEAEYTWRRVDNLLTPTRGYMAQVAAGGGVPGVSTKGFGRVVAKVNGWWPIDRLHELTARGEAGAVIASSRDGIPSPFLFRTGGDTTVRGYAFDSLGVPLDNATVGGRYYFVGSTEITRWFGESWGIATFVDAGNAFDSPHDVDVALGYGVGLRVRTPIGPFRIDLAYGQQSHSVRLHFSVGLSF